MESKAVCDKDCFNCKHPDCICDDMDDQDRREAAKIDRILFPEGKRRAKLSESEKKDRWKAWYRENRERCRENNAKWRSAHPNYYRDRYMEHREERLAYQAAYDREHREERNRKQRERNRRKREEAKKCGNWQ